MPLMFASVGLCQRSIQFAIFALWVNWTTGTSVKPTDAASCARDNNGTHCVREHLLLQRNRLLSSSTTAGNNIFEGAAFYVNPSYSESLSKSIGTAQGQIQETLKSMQDMPSAYWLDTKAKIEGTGPKTMEGILADASSKNPPQLATFIVYDLPNRDCHAKASNGEICCTYNKDGSCDYFANGNCEAGLEEYKRDYIDKIAGVLEKYEGKVPMVLVIEPDSLPNLSTNRGDRRCGNSGTVAAYTQGIAYAVKTLAVAAPSAAIYQDAGHGGWLGWKNNMQDFVQNVKSLGVWQHLRGFATNVAGYQALGLVCPTYDWCLNNAHPNDPCCFDPCGLTGDWNPSHNELNYALHLSKAMSEGIAGFSPRVIIDTGRNGVADERLDCKNWCNIRGAGVGHKPTADTVDKSIIDAYFWLKTPGESDGCTQTLPDGQQCPRFDADCMSVDSLGSRSGEPRAPEAGQWFDYQIKQLAANSRMGIANTLVDVEGNPTVQPSPGVATNPFVGKSMYVNPSYSESLDKSIGSATGSVKETLQSMRGKPSAYWLDTKAKVEGTGPKTMEGILADASSKSPPKLVAFIVYDLPNRDCHAKASNGEICCTYNEDGSCNYLTQGDCAAGLREYETHYIDKIASVLSKYEGKVPIVLVIEPDSLPNLSTNRADRRCGNSATVTAYQKGVSYAVSALAAAAPSAAIYLDAGHGGWLGWKNNMQDFVGTVRALDVTQHLRGFATNVAGYQALGQMCPTYDWCLNNAHPNDSCCFDPCGLTGEWNPSHNELNYALHLGTAFSESITGFQPHVIIDTGRNGVADERNDCKNWCNIRGAGVGHVPTVETANQTVVDAYFWLKTPGESDGCTESLPDGSSCARFDDDCASEDSLGSRDGEPRAPEAGLWFDYQIKQLATNANMV